MKILLTGASGFIGSAIGQALGVAGHEVIPITRLHGFDFNRMLTPQDWLPHLQGVAAVINSVGIIAETRGQAFAALHEQAPAALFRACAQAGVTRVVQISALGADAAAFTPYQRSKKAADDVLRSLALDWFVLRPSLVYGRGGKSSALFQRIAMLPVIPLPGNGRQVIQPVHISDLVATVMRCLDAVPTQRTLDVVGAYPLQFGAWLQYFRKAQGKPAAPVMTVPFGLVLASAQLGKWLVPMLHPDNLRMLQRGNAADVQPLAAFLNRMPLSVEAGSERRTV